MKLVFVAGAFTGKTAWEVEQNVRRAEEVGLTIANLGALPVIPHTNTRFFHGQCDDQFWYQGYLKLVEAVHAVEGAMCMVSPGWWQSTGAVAENEKAKNLGMPVFDSNQYEPLKGWIDGES